MNRFLARSQRFRSVGSTNDVVRDWLAEGTPEVCLAIADEQTAGRGREGRAWVAPDGAALLLSLGFRPTWLEPERVWRLAAVTSLAMAEAAETVADLPDGTIRLKWPNDLVVEPRARSARKLAGVLGETAGLGTRDPRVIVGLGINADWAGGRLPAGARGHDDLAARGGARSPGRPDRAVGRLRRPACRGGSSRCAADGSTPRTGRSAS